MRVSYFSPLPPEQSGVADYSALLLPALARRIDVAVVRRGRRKSARGSDVALYHVGNDPEAHGWIVEALRGEPGVVVLHEWVLHHLVAGLTLARRDVATYLEAMEREAGLVGRLLALGVVDGCVPPLWEHRPEDFPLASLVLDATNEMGVVVHSHYIADRVRASGYGGPVWQIPHPAWPRPDVDEVDLGSGPVVGCLGHLTPSKRIAELVEAFAVLRARRPDVRLLLVGQAPPRFDVDALVRRAELAPDAVLREGYVDERRLWSLMAACDVCVSLRAPTMGETSGTAIRALSLGRPLIVSDVGWFSELPDGVAFKVPPAEGEVETLAATLELLLGDEMLRRDVAERAREYVEREHDVERVAELYAAALEEAAGGRAVRERLVDEVAGAAADVGIDAGTPEADELAARLAEVARR